MAGRRACAVKGTDDYRALQLQHGSRIGREWGGVEGGGGGGETGRRKTSSLEKVNYCGGAREKAPLAGLR